MNIVMMIMVIITMIHINDNHNVVIIICIIVIVIINIIIMVCARGQFSHQDLPCRDPRRGFLPVCQYHIQVVVAGVVVTKALF